MNWPPTPILTLFKDNNLWFRCWLWAAAGTGLVLFAAALDVSDDGVLQGDDTNGCDNDDGSEDLKHKNMISHVLVVCCCKLNNT